MLSAFGGISFFNIQKNQNLEIQDISPVEYVYISIPEGYTTNVSLSDYVKSGQVIAKKDRSPHICSSVSGTIEHISENKIIVKNDFLDTQVENKFIVSPLLSMSEKEVLDLINSFSLYDGGIPLSQKIISAENKIENVIISCIDAEPTKGTAKELILKFAPKIIGGIKIILHATKARRGIVAIGSTLEELQQNIESEINDNALISTRIVESKYPIENEKCLLYALTHRETSDDSFYEEGKSLILKAETVINLFESMSEGLPVLTKLITVSGKIKEPKNLLVPIGTKIENILDFCQNSTIDNYSIIENGLMKGKEVSLDDVVKYDTDSITIIKKRTFTETDCIRCGKCIDVCPMLLKPFLLYADIKNDNSNKTIISSAKHCIGCGCCSYVCPSRIKLSNTIFQFKNQA